MQTNRTLLLSFFCMLSFVLCSTISFAQIIRYVKAGANGDGTSWDNASGNLQAMINDAGVQQVWVATGTYKPSSNTTDRTTSFSLKNGVSILGGFPATGAPVLSDRNPASLTTVLSGDIDNDGTLVNNSYHVINNTGLNNTAVLDGFVITMGNANATASPDNQGGGLYLNGSSPSLLNCRLVGNNAGDRGGGLYNTGGGNPTVVNSSLESNTASFGGAIYTRTGSLKLISSSLINNAASGNGGAIVNFLNSSLTVVNCSLSSNTSPSGGALVNGDFATAQLVNCVLWNNGGAISITRFSGSILLANSLTEPSVTNYSNQGGNLTTSTSPFASTASVALAACSPAINAGAPASQTIADGPYSANALPATDLEGNPRIAGGRVDMGAVEFQGTPNYPVAFTGNPSSGSVVCAGAGVSASVSVTGTIVSYKWYKDGSPVESQTAATLSLPNAQTADAGSYSVVVTGACNSVTSTAFRLTVNALPTVSISATSTVLTCANPSLTLTATSSATALRWSTNETTTSIVVSTTGTYSVTATTPNGCTAVSNNLSVSQDLSLPLFTINSVSVCQGQTTSLLASGCSGQVRWSTGTTGSSLTVTAGSSTSVLSATCTVGSCQAVASGSVVVGQVLPPPAQILSLSAEQSTCPVRLVGRGVGTSFVFTNAQGYVFSHVYRLGGIYDVLGLAVKQPGVYTLTATYTNECGTSVPVSRTVNVSRSCP